jgi:regulator of protease activity HflC (stomatin/prohibitin superfamily)
MVLEAQGEQEAAIKRAEATVRSIQMLSQALQNQGDTSEILNYLLAQRYVDANQRLGESENSKVVFMDPRMLTEGIAELMQTDAVTPKKDSDDFPSRRR